MIDRNTSGSENTSEKQHKQDNNREKHNTLRPSDPSHNFFVLLNEGKYQRNI